MRVVINVEVGGFNLSTAVMNRLFALGWHAPEYVPVDDPFNVECPYQWFGPDGTEYDIYEIPFRSNPDVVAAVEDLGDASHPTITGSLAIIEVPDGLALGLDENEMGIEWVYEQHRVWGAHR